MRKALGNGRVALLEKYELYLLSVLSLARPPFFLSLSLCTQILGPVH